MNSPTAAIQAIQLKGRMLMVSVLRIHQVGEEQLSRDLVARREEAPDLIRELPIVIDLEPVAAADTTELATAVARVRDEGFKVIGLQAGDAATRLQAAMGPASGLPLLRLGGSGELPLSEERSRTARATQPSTDAGAAADPEPVCSPTRIIDQPVRSGQQVYARGGDLLITEAVSHGAELLADGNIFVLGALRGRALAGVRGLATARIFCRRLDAELLSIAGHYRIAEDITEDERGENRLVTLQGESLKITTA